MKIYLPAGEHAAFADLKQASSVCMQHIDTRLRTQHVTNKLMGVMGCLFTCSNARDDHDRRAITL